MRAQICFFVSIAFSFVAWGVVTASLILPELRRRGRYEALRPLLMFHSFRFVGLAFLVPGVVSPDLPAAVRRRRRLWRYRRRGARFVNAGVAAWQAWHRRGLGIQSVGQRRYHPRQLRRHSLRRPAGQLGAAYFLPTFIVPLFLITHGLMFGFYYETKTKPPCRPRRGSPKVSRAATCAAPRYRRVSLLPNTASMGSN